MNANRRRLAGYGAILLVGGAAPFLLECVDDSLCGAKAEGASPSEHQGVDRDGFDGVAKDSEFAGQLARPKSMNLAIQEVRSSSSRPFRISLASRMFSGLMSPWEIPRSCM